MNLHSTHTNAYNLSDETLKEELLSTLLDLDQEEAYPWNPFDPEMDDYLDNLEKELAFGDLLETDFDEKSNSFLENLHQKWSQVDSSSHLPIRQSLYQRFSSFLPKNLIESIIDQAEQIATQNLNQLNQVVECVRPLWSSWTTEDLQVFARPVVYAMRDNTPKTKAPWEELTEFEQIRLTMAVAQEAIQELSTPCQP